MALCPVFHISVIITFRSVRPTFKLPFQLTKRDLADYLEAKDPMEDVLVSGPGPEAASAAANLVMANIEMAARLVHGGFTHWRDRLSNEKVRNNFKKRNCKVANVANHRVFAFFRCFGNKSLPSSISIFGSAVFSNPVAIGLTSPG